jgi:predicted Zn-dependent peptidase
LVEEITLSNGLKLVAEETPWQQGVSFGLFVRGAVVDEPAGQEGIAHLLEHLVFKGTEKFRGAALSAAIEEDGGELNAYTTKEYTCLWGRTLPDAFARQLELLVELFQHPLLRPRDLQREVQVIEEEHALWLDNPEEFACDLLEEEIFSGSALGRRVLGVPDALRRLTVQDVRAFHAAHWRIERCVLAVSGPVPPEAAASIAERLFRPSSPAPARRRSLGRESAAQVLPSQLSQVHLAVGGPALAFQDPGLAAQGLLIQEFGGGPNSRLFQRLREEDALSYGVYGYETAYAGGGMWGVYADLPPDGLQAGLAAILEEADALRRARLGAARIAQMRRSACGALRLAQDSPFARVERYALQVLLRGRPEPLEQEIAEIEAVDGLAIRRAAQQLFDPSQLRCVALLPDGRMLRGSVEELADQEEGTSWSR